MSEFEAFRQFVDRHAPITVLGGAGISTASGIPDYRDADGQWKNASPVQYGDFIGKQDIRRRYWARSYAGWKNIRDAAPNRAHYALAAMQRSKQIDTLITQNVDCLHDRAGSTDVIDLHGRLDQTICLGCGTREPREHWQQRLAAANPNWNANVDYYKPDGDAELDAAKIATFVVPDCSSCGGIVKPDVVFFGENVPTERVARAMQSVSRSKALLVVGSSLMVFSGFRFARLAHQENIALAIVNRGKTRADDLATLKINADCGAALATVAAV